MDRNADPPPGTRMVVAAQGALPDIRVLLEKCDAAGVTASLAACKGKT